MNYEEYLKADEAAKKLANLSSTEIAEFNAETAKREIADSGMTLERYATAKSRSWEYTEKEVYNSVPEKNKLEMDARLEANELWKLEGNDHASVLKFLKTWGSGDYGSVAPFVEIKNKLISLENVAEWGYYPDRGLVVGDWVLTLLEASDNDYEEAPVYIVFTVSPKNVDAKLKGIPEVKTYRYSGYYSSYEGAEYDTLDEVKPVEKTITVWKRV